MKTFKVIRNNDESGISGTGVILEGAIYSNGKVVVYWLGKNYNSFGIYDHFYAFHFIHIRSHPTNDTEIHFNEKIANSVKRERRQTCRHCKNLYSEHPRDLQWQTDGNVRSCSGNLVELVNEEQNT